MAKIQTGGEGRGWGGGGGVSRAGRRGVQIYTHGLHTFRCKQKPPQIKVILGMNCHSLFTASSINVYCRNLKPQL